MFRNPRLTLAIIGGLSTGVIIAVALFFTVLKTDSGHPVGTDPEEQTEPSPTPVLPSATKQLFEDDAGFTFSYPADVVVETQDLAKTDYAHLSMTSTRTEGSIVLVASDTSVTAIDDWVEENIPEASESAMTNVKLGDLEAKEIVMEDGIAMVALDMGVIFTIDIRSDTHLDYWKHVYRTVLESFAFSLPESEPADTAPAQDTGGGIMFEGEEMIE